VRRGIRKAAQMGGVEIDNRKREDRRIGEITTERIPANRRARFARPACRCSGGVIDPAMRPVRA